MSSRNVSLGAMYGWVSGSFAMMRRHTTPLLAASGLSLLLYLLMYLPSVAVMWPLLSASGDAALLAATAMQRLFWTYGVMMVLLLVLMPPLLVGWMRLLRDLDLGHATRGVAVLNAYRDGPVWIRSVLFGLLALLALLVLMLLFALAFWAPISSFFQSAVAQHAATMTGISAPPPAISSALVLAYFGFVFVMFYGQLAYMVGFAEISLRPTPLLAALSAAVVAVLRNSLKLLLWAISLAIAMMIVFLVLGMLLGLLVVALTLISPKLAPVLMLILYLPLLLVLYPLMFSGAYLAWKDLLGDNAPEPFAATLDNTVAV